MFVSISLRLLCGVAFVILLAQPVTAGGWTVVTLDELPVNVQAGEPFIIGFMVRQHGRHPINLDATGITAYHPASGEAVHAPARQEGETGHYVAEIVLPQAGTWTWRVLQGPFQEAAMPELYVSAPPEPLEAKTVRPLYWGSTLVTPAMLGALPFLGWNSAAVTAAVTMVEQTQSVKRPDRVMTVTNTVTKETMVDPVVYGKALFTAKGCATCHLHEQVETAFSVQSGPDLSHYTVVPDYVRLWLQNPSVIKPATDMPQLNLGDEEINALIAFLSAPLQ